MWTQIANKMEHYDYHLLYAGFNEPGLSDKEQDKYYILTHYAQDFVDAVRATGGNNAERVLVVQAPSTSTEIAVSGQFELPQDVIDARMMLEVHFYGLIPYLWDTPGGVIKRQDGSIDQPHIMDAILEARDQAVSPY